MIIVEELQSMISNWINGCNINRIERLTYFTNRTSSEKGTQQNETYNLGHLEAFDDLVLSNQVIS